MLIYFGPKAASTGGGDIKSQIYPPPFPVLMARREVRKTFQLWQTLEKQENSHFIFEKNQNGLKRQEIRRKKK